VTKVWAAAVDMPATVLVCVEVVVPVEYITVAFVAFASPLI